MPLPVPAVLIPCIHEAYQLCMEVGFVSSFLDNKERRNILLPRMEKGKYMSLDEYYAQIYAVILYFEKENAITPELRSKVAELIPEYFEQSSGYGVEVIICFATLHWLLDRKHASAAIEFHPISD